MMPSVARQIGDMVVQALLHRIGGAVSVDVAILAHGSRHSRCGRERAWG